MIIYIYSYVDGYVCMYVYIYIYMYTYIYIYIYTLLHDCINFNAVSHYTTILLYHVLHLGAELQHLLLLLGHGHRHAALEEELVVLGYITLDVL